MGILLATGQAAGTILVVRPSEVLPVDGRLLSPTAVFDESTLTGKSLPAESALAVEIGQASGQGSC
ncbi:hypothetical protein [Arthrobacter sp. R-11]|uniref:P-type ATPase n=1 Tax=Arthrobacter sp. R-11 TaxID=3404053 RepID=UPI003CEA4615